MSERGKQTDILERLRFHAANMPGRGLTAEIFRLAADEIERLRAKLTEATEQRRIEIDVIREERAADREEREWQARNAEWGQP